MTRLIYPGLQGPVLDSAQRPETVTESRWHRALAEPMRPLRGAAFAAALAASGCVFVASVAPPPPGIGPALQALAAIRPLAEPVCVAAGLSAAVRASTGGRFLQPNADRSVGFCRHYTGVLTPRGAKTVDAYGWEVFDQFVPDPVPAAEYVTGTIDTGYDASLRVFFTLRFGMGFGQAGDPAFATAIDTWRSGATDPGSFVLWDVGYVTLRYLRAKLSYTPVAGAVAFLSDFTPTIDTAPTIETGASIVVAAGGSVVAFPQAFHVTPQVVATCISNVALTVSVANVTPTQCTFHVWNAAGSDVGGTINYQAVGE